MVEMAAVLPLLFIMMFAVLQFSVVMHNKVMLEESVGVAARTLALTRATTNPCSTAVTALKNAAVGLASGSLNITIRVNNTDYGPSNSPTCAGQGATMTAGSSATVTSTFPWSIGFYGMYIYSGNFSSSTVVRVE